ncbi:MAG: metallophosphoesterase [Gaiellales bacterium]
MPGDIIRAVQITDCHLVDDGAEHERAIDTWATLAAVIDRVRRETPALELVLATGDLSQDGSAGSYRRVQSLFERLEIPVYCLPGNHDVPATLGDTLAGERIHVERSLVQGRWQIVFLDTTVAGEDDGALSAAELAATIGWAGAGAWSPFMWPLAATSLFVIGPEHAEMFAAAGWTKDDLRQAIYEEVRRPAGELRRGETTPTVEQADDDELIPKWTGPERIVIVVAGGEAGRFSAVIGPSLGMDAEVLTREV